MSSHPHKFVWFELATQNVDEATDFYTSVVPWGTTEYEEAGEKPYTMWTVGDKMAGGVMELPEESAESGAPPHWMGYVDTDDIHASLEKLERHGGSCESDVIDIGEAGRFAVVSDPTGALFALHESLQVHEGEMPEQNVPGAVSWIELSTPDVDAAWEFYSQMFDWEKYERSEVADGLSYQLFGWEGRERGGISEMRSDDQTPPSWLFYFTVEDLDAAVERVEAEGGAVLNGPMDVPGGDRIAHCLDPQGARFALHIPYERLV